MERFVYGLYSLYTFFNISMDVKGYRSHVRINSGAQHISIRLLRISIARLPATSGVTVKSRRVQGKRPPPEWYVALEVDRVGEADSAILCQDARRFHVHYTHVRTRSPCHTQPDQLTRKQVGTSGDGSTARRTRAQTAPRAASCSSAWLQRAGIAPLLLRT